MAQTLEPQVHLWTRDEYYKMAEAGLFERKHVELIEGRIIEMSPMGSPHRTAVVLAGDALRRAFTTGHFVQTQSPLTLGAFSEPEPDVAVIQGQARDYTSTHPNSAILVVEISDSSLLYDRTEKASLYAKSGIPEYWIINLTNRQVEVYRDPVSDPSSLSGHTYREIKRLGIGESVSPLALPRAVIAVVDLLP